MKGLHPITEESLVAIMSALNGAKVRYLVVGGLAVVSHGYLRVTADLHLVIKLDPENVARALRVLQDLDYKPSVPVALEEFADPAKRREWIETKGMVVLNLVNDTTRATPIDVFVTEPFEFDEEYARASWVDLGKGTKCSIIGKDGLLRMKREAGRPRDLDDIDKLEKVDPNTP